MTSFLRNVALFLWVRGGLANQSTYASTGTPPTVSTIQSASSVSATCPSKTINFITHTLAQQCLTERTPHSNIQASTPNAKDATLTTSSLSLNLTVTLTQTVHAPTDTVTLEFTVSSEDGNVAAIASSTLNSFPTTSVTDDGATKPSAGAEEDAESPLDNAHFLSFEEWKNQNLAKAGQSPEDIGRGQPVDASRQRPGINNALDTLGEEHEISLDFAGFGGPVPVHVADSHSSRSHARPSATTMAGQQDLAAQSLRSKDAGKTCKERTNYASFDCAATILKSNKECKSASSVLVEHKDSYMLNICEVENKFFIVELCDDIQIDTIVLANYEFFSSTFRHFRVSVSDRYPVKMEKWKDLGTFEAQSTREVQAFLVPNPLIWARYLRIEFLTHYGLEYYCPVSILRVHGTTMWEDYRHQEEIARGEVEEATLDVEALATLPVAQEPMESTDALSSKLQAISLEEKSAEVSDTVTVTESMQGSLASPLVSDVTPAASPALTDHVDLEKVLAETTTALDLTATSLSNVTNRSTLVSSSEASISVEAQDFSPSVRDASPMTATEILEGSATLESATTSGISLPAAANTSTTAVALKPGSGRDLNATNVPSSDVGVPTAVDAANLTTQSGSSTNTTRTVASTTNSQPAQPSTQESFFKSFHKRLQQLESNSTLSLQYIEEQSRILRDAFTKVEKRQLVATTNFLSQLNSTVMAELHGFRQSYDQLWQSTVIELEGQREAYQGEMLALSTRLTMVADELVWQKRMGIIQSTLLLLCLALAIFTRSENGYLEVPLMQNVMSRSTSVLRRSWESPPNSPSPDSRSPVSLFRRWRASPEIDRSASDTDVSRTRSRGKPNITIEVPSPNAGGAQSGYFDGQDAHGAPEKEPGEDKRGSPKKQRKKAKKSRGLQVSQDRAKSPLAL